MRECCLANAPAGEVRVCGGWVQGDGCKGMGGCVCAGGCMCNEGGAVREVTVACQHDPEACVHGGGGGGGRGGGGGMRHQDCTHLTPPVALLNLRVDAKQLGLQGCDLLFSRILKGMAGEKVHGEGPGFVRCSTCVAASIKLGHPG